MKLLTKAIIKKLPELYTTEKIPDTEKTVPLKLFAPWSNWTWYAVEGRPEVDEDGKPTGDWLFFGLVEGHEREWGYFTLKELEAVNGPFGLKIERDLYWDDTTTVTALKEKLGLAA